MLGHRLPCRAHALERPILPGASCFLTGVKSKEHIPSFSPCLLFRLGLRHVQLCTYLGLALALLHLRSAEFRFMHIFDGFSERVPVFKRHVSHAPRLACLDIFQHPGLLNLAKGCKRFPQAFVCDRLGQVRLLCAQRASYCLVTRITGQLLASHAHNWPVTRESRA